MRNEPNFRTAGVSPAFPHPNYAKRTQLTPPRVIPSVGLRSETQRPKAEGPAKTPSPKAIPNKTKPARTPKNAKQTQFPYTKCPAKPNVMSYYEVPIEILENKDRLGEWAQKALQVATAAKDRKGR